MKRVGSSKAWGLLVWVSAILLAGFLLWMASGQGELVLAQEKPEKPAQKSLYQRLGGYDAIAAVVDEFLIRLRSDPQFARFGTGRGDDSKKRARQLIVDQICALAGGPCLYIGRDMKASHAGLAITDQEWEASLKHLEAVLDKFRVQPKEKQELMALVNDLKKDIVEKPKK